MLFAKKNKDANCLIPMLKSASFMFLEDFSLFRVDPSKIYSIRYLISISIRDDYLIYPNFVSRAITTKYDNV